MRYLNRSETVTRKVTSMYETQKILQLKDSYIFEVGQYMYKCNKSQVPATFNNYFKLITDVHCSSV